MGCLKLPYYEKEDRSNFLGVWKKSDGPEKISNYYPFGLVMDGREITDEPYRYGYQGQYAEKDSVTGWNQFQLRFYDARIARWLSSDPYGQYYSPYVAMGNMPHMSIDPDGGWNWMTAGIGFGVGALAGYAATGDWEGALAGGLAGGLIGGASFNKGNSGGMKVKGGGYREYGGFSPPKFNSKMYASIGNFIDNIDLFPTALTLTKHAFSTIGRRTAEEYFVRKNYNDPNYSGLKKDYGRTEDASGTDYSGFTESGSVNVNQALGSNSGPYRGKDPATGEEIGISRVFPKVNLNVSQISDLTHIGGYGINSNILGGPGYVLSSGNPNNAAQLTVAFKSKGAATKFHNTHFKGSFNQKMAQMQKKYFKIHK
jgi:RHS repeat-associated protein